MPDRFAHTYDTFRREKITGMALNGEYVPSPSARSRDQVELFERTDGAEGNTLRGVPIVVVTSIGAKSGKVRKTPLMRVEHGGEYAIVASQGGAPEHPQWYHNLVAHPVVELQDGPVRREYRAAEVTGEERDTWWRRAAAVWPDYDDYQERTSRQIPVFVLRPV
jgi:deazaflavin-dependent oxidoreductase (nitroreductase family)